MTREPARPSNPAPFSRLKLAALLSLSLLGSWQPSAVLADDCLSRGVQALVAESLLSFPELLAAAKRGFPDLDRNTFWLREHGDPRHSAVQRIVDSAHRLPESQRMELWAQLRDRPDLADTRLRDIFALALYDENSWRRFVDRISSSGSMYPDLTGSLVPLLEHMPEPLVKAINKDIGNVYGAASSQATAGGRHFALPPKRGLDAFIRFTLKPDQLITSRIAAGESPRDALQAYIAKVQEIIPARIVPRYSIEDVQKVSLIIQRHLKEQAAAKGLTGSAEVTLFGSLPNGRAKLHSSDLDVYVSHPELQDLFPDADDEIVRALARETTPVGLHLKTAPPLWAQWEMGRINPVMLRIREDRTDMLVYPPFTVTDTEVETGLRAMPVPEVFRLDGPGTGWTYDGAAVTRDIRKSEAWQRVLATEDTRRAENARVRITDEAKVQVRDANGSWRDSGLREPPPGIIYREAHIDRDGHLFVELGRGGSGFNYVGPQGKPTVIASQMRWTGATTSPPTFRRMAADPLGTGAYGVDSQGGLWKVLPPTESRGPFGIEKVSHVQNIADLLATPAGLKLLYRDGRIELLPAPSRGWFPR